MARGSIQEKTVDPNFSDLASSSVTRGASYSRCRFRGRTDSIAAPLQHASSAAPGDRRTSGLRPADDGAPPLPRYRSADRTAPPGAEVLQLVGTPWHVTKAEILRRRRSSMEIFPSKEDPIGQLLPCNAVLGAFILRGDMYTERTSGCCSRI